MTVSADSAGVVSGKFTIPSGILAGSKAVSVIGSGGSQGTATFVGQGTLVKEVLQRAIRTSRWANIDPLAQTFSLLEERQIGGVDVFVTAKGTTPISVQIRETQNGFPTKSILAETSLSPSAITAGNWNRFEFQTPVKLLSNVEYAFVVLCNDSVSSVAIAELGKWDNANGRWVSQQPYQVGVLLSSSNASTWTAHQDRDMAFHLLARKYTETSKEVDLGTVAASGATDLVILSMIDNPSTGADGEIKITMPDNSTLSASDGQNVKLSSAVTGNIGVKALLRATEKMSAVLHPGCQLATGTLDISAEYVTRAIPADAAGCSVNVIFDAQIPSGSTVSVFVKGVDAGDTWQAVSQNGTAKALGDDYYEYQYLKTSVTEARVQIKIVLTGTAAARPYVKNLRVSTI